MFILLCKHLINLCLQSVQQVHYYWRHCFVILSLKWSTLLFIYFFCLQCFYILLQIINSGEVWSRRRPWYGTATPSYPETWLGKLNEGNTKIHIVTNYKVNNRFSYFFHVMKTKPFEMYNPGHPTQRPSSLIGFGISCRNRTIILWKPCCKPCVYFINRLWIAFRMGLNKYNTLQCPVLWRRARSQPL